MPVGADTAATERSALLTRPAASGDSDDTAVEHGGISTARAVVCIVALAILVMLQATNISLLTVAQSAIASDLDAFEQTSWFTSAFLIAMSTAGPIHGKLAQILSPPVSIFICALIMSVGTLVTALSGTFVAFIVGRVITGAGAGGIFIVSVIIVLDLSTAENRGLFIGGMNTLMTVGVSAGATVAGALLPVTGWRALFWLQAPAALFFGIVILFAIPRSFGKEKNSKDDQGLWKNLASQDYAGAFTMTLAIVLLLLAISSPTRISITPIIVSVVIMTVFVVIELRYAKSPIIPVALLKSSGLLLTCLATVGYMMSRWSILFYTPIYAIAVRSWSPASGGAILIPTNTGFALGGLLVGWLYIRKHQSYYAASLLMYILFPINLVMLALTSTATSSPVFLVAVVFVNGLITGSALNLTFAHCLYLTPKSTHYMVTTIMATFRGFAGSFASAAGGGYFVRVLRESLTEEYTRHDSEPDQALIRRLLGSPALVQTLHGVDKAVAVESYTKALRALWIGAAILALAFATLQALTGRRPAAEEQEEDDEESVEARAVDAETGAV